MSSSEAAAIIRFEGAVPQFTVPDVVRTAEYYRDVLGFHIAGYWGTPPVFAILWRDQVELFFNRADQSEFERAGPGVRMTHTSASSGWRPWRRSYARWAPTSLRAPWFGFTDSASS